MDSTSDNLEPESIEVPLSLEKIPLHILERMANKKLSAIGPALCERFGFVVDHKKVQVTKGPTQAVVKCPYTIPKDIKTTFRKQGELVIDIPFDTGVPSVKVVSSSSAKNGRREIPIDFREVAARYVEILGNAYSRTIFHIGESQDNAILGGLWRDEIQEAQKSVSDDATIVVQGVRVNLKTLVFPGI